jgi:hypothetical protein
MSAILTRAMWCRHQAISVDATWSPCSTCGSSPELPLLPPPLLLPPLPPGAAFEPPGDPRRLPCRRHSR